MAEALEMIRALWDGKRLTEQKEALLGRRCLHPHVAGDRRPPIYVSAFGPQAAKVAGRLGDGLWTLADPHAAIEVYGRAVLPKLGAGSIFR